MYYSDFPPCNPCPRPQEKQRQEEEEEEEEEEEDDGEPPSVRSSVQQLVPAWPPRRSIDFMLITTTPAYHNI